MYCQEARGGGGEVGKWGEVAQTMNKCKNK
jgi:hypothetical protein